MSVRSSRARAVGAPLIASLKALASSDRFAGPIVQATTWVGAVSLLRGQVQFPLIRASVNTSAIAATGNRRKSVRWRNKEMILAIRISARLRMPWGVGRIRSRGSAKCNRRQLLLLAKANVARGFWWQVPPAASRMAGVPKRAWGGQSASLPKISVDSPRGSSLGRFARLRRQRGAQRS